MSSDDPQDLRLASLGLLHLKEKPAELKAALDRILKEREAFEAKGQKELEAIRAKAANVAKGRSEGPSAPSRISGVNEGDDQARLSRLISFYLDAPMSHAPGTPEQEQALQALSEVVLSARGPAAPDRSVLAARVASVKKLWPTTSRPKGSALATLLEAAEILARR